jgi:hypothetical protein
VSTTERALLARAHAGLTSPALRPSAATSADDNFLTVDASTAPAPSFTLPRYFLVASTALSGLAMATLQYSKDGAPNIWGPIHARLPERTVTCQAVPLIRAEAPLVGDDFGFGRASAK